MSIFIDTNVFVAYLNKRDVNHRRAANLIKKLEKGEFGQVYISDYVFSEIVTVVMLKVGLRKAIEIGEFLLDEVEILRVNDEVFVDAWEIFKQVKMSFTDCTIAAMVRTYEIDFLATFDRGFERFEWLKIVR